jgi:hypothetical protein
MTRNGETDPLLPKPLAQATSNLNVASGSFEQLSASPSPTEVDYSRRDFPSQRLERSDKILFVSLLVDSIPGEHFFGFGSARLERFWDAEIL